MVMKVTLDFRAYYQGESEYRVRGGAQDGAIVTVIAMSAKWFADLFKEMPQSPLRQKLMQEMMSRAGTVSVENGVVDWDILCAARNRFRSFMRLWPEFVSGPLQASACVNGRWMRVPDHKVPGCESAASEEVGDAVVDS
jgi:hypothetical protein